MKRFVFLIFLTLLVVFAFSSLAECPNHSGTMMWAGNMTYYEEGVSLFGNGHYRHVVTLYQCSVCGYPEDNDIQYEWSPHQIVSGQSFSDYEKTSTTHMLITIIPKSCGLCRKIMENEIIPQGTPEPHIGSINNWYDAGHYGIYHYYDSICTKCGIRFLWRKIVCPGGNNHVGPSSFVDPGVTE